MRDVIAIATATALVVDVLDVGRRQPRYEDTNMHFPGGLLHYLTDDWADQEKFPGTGWANTEFRSYTFDTSR